MQHSLQGNSGDITISSPKSYFSRSNKNSVVLTPERRIAQWNRIEEPNLTLCNSRHLNFLQTPKLHTGKETAPSTNAIEKLDVYTQEQIQISIFHPTESQPKKHQRPHHRTGNSEATGGMWGVFTQALLRSSTPGLQLSKK